MFSGGRRWLPSTLLLLGDTDGRSFFDSLVHFLGGQQRPDGHSRVSTHIGVNCAVAAAISSG